jgi:hypothetical protein
MNYDDEGTLAVALRQFLEHGSLYHHTHGSYGPFYYSFEGLIYRATGQTPTLFNGRLFVLALTAVSAGFFAAAVWRVTRSLAFGVLCEIVTYSFLIVIAGREPLHPGPLIVLLLSVMAYALVSYAMQPRTAHLVVVGAVVGALVMTKVNVGVLAVVGVVVAFVIGNQQYSKRVRALVAAAGLLTPFLLMYSLIWQTPKAQFAVVVSFSLLAAYAPWHVDEISIPARGLFVAAAAAVVTVVVSCLWPLFNGSSPGSLIAGVFLRPEVQTKVHSDAFLLEVENQWLVVLLTAFGAYLALERRRIQRLWPGGSWLLDAGLAVAALYVLGQVVSAEFAVWLPAAALIPALAWISGAPPAVRLALRFLVAVSILQMLHAYPIAGAQRVWGAVLVCVPCAIALAVAVGRQQLWQQAGPAARALAVGTLCAVLLVGAGTWPPEAWRNYKNSVALGLPGTRWVRLDPNQALNLQVLTQIVRDQCDTFYSAPAFGALYIFTSLPTPTGHLANWPGVLTESEQRELVSQLEDLEADGKRVCVVRDHERLHLWTTSSYGTGPLGKGLAPYNKIVGRVSKYSVSVRGS